MTSIFRKVIFMITPVLLTALVFTYKPASEANAPAGFSHSYGLLVHNRNQDQAVTRIKALEVLLNYFDLSEIVEQPEVEMTFTDLEIESDYYHMAYRGCQLGLLNCNQASFNPNVEITQKDFLVWFFQLREQAEKKKDRIDYTGLSNGYFKAWLEARRLNLLPGNTITNENLEDFLFRYQVVKAHYGFPYQKGMLLDYNNIDVNHYTHLKEIQDIVAGLEAVRDNFRQSDELTENERLFIEKINVALEKFHELENLLTIKPFILHKRNDLPEEVVTSIKEYGLQEVLYSYSYYYGDNAPYRQHNLITGTNKMQGKVYQPGEVIDYWNVLMDKNLSDFKYGWVIANGVEEWQFGGGICGSSSMVYLPAWKAGLEILERKNHSKYYSNLYPIEQIGLDATVYRPRPNLKIKNNFNDPIVFNVIDDQEAQTITLEIIGNSKYKNIEIEGPIFVTPRHIQWIRHMEDYDGNITSEVVESKYGTVYK